MLKDTLKYLQWQGLGSAEKPWLLKAPSYYGFEPDLLSVFPDARIAMTHRTPLSTVPSLCKLVNQFHIPFDSARVDGPALEKDLAGVMQLHMDNRKNIPGLKFLDILFEDVVNDMTAVARSFYDYIGMPLSEQSLHNILNWNSGNPIHKKVNSSIPSKNSI
jgi:hypothetical protein